MIYNAILYIHETTHKNCVTAPQSYCTIWVPLYSWDIFKIDLVANDHLTSLQGELSFSWCMRHQSSLYFFKLIFSPLASSVTWALRPQIHTQPKCAHTHSVYFMPVFDLSYGQQQKYKQNINCCRQLVIVCSENKGDGMNERQSAPAISRLSFPWSKLLCIIHLLSCFDDISMSIIKKKAPDPACDCLSNRTTETVKALCC